MQIVLAFALIILAAVSRLFDHPANFTPVAAVTLFSGAYLPRTWGWLVPVLVMLATDAIIGFYDWQVMAAVYASLVATVLVGFMLRRKRSVGSVLTTSLGSSVLFFLVTNAAVWAWGGLYERTATGLLTSYAMGVPFFKNTLLGDLFYTGFLFGIYELVCMTQYAAQTRKSTIS